MIIQPKVRGFICTTAHPDGCAQHVAQWIEYAKKQAPMQSPPRRVLVIGASTGFGLASRITAAFGAGAATLGVFYEKSASGKRTASAGWYNSAAFERAAHQANLYAKSFNGDAFATQMKDRVIETISKDWGGQVDLVVYSIAAPRRQDPKSGDIFNSVLKPLTKSYQNKTVDVMTGRVTDVVIEPANEQDIAATIAVMGGEDWQLWIERLLQEGLLADKATTVAFTYIGPEITHPIYRNGTIGKAKEHLEQTARELNKQLQQSVHGQAFISVNKALVTQASAAIPVVPLYISLLYKVMKSRGLHEGCIEQMWRLFTERLYQPDVPRDAQGRIRIDDWEMRDDVQNEVARLWSQVNNENLEKISDINGYRSDFYKLFGFGIHGVDYNKDVAVAVPIPSIEE